MFIRCFVELKIKMDDLEEYSPQVGELEATFNKAANYLQSLAATLQSDKLLFLYARYKQANEGPCNTSKPGFFDFKGKQKWEAWNALGDLTKDDAMKEYVDCMSEVDPEWQLKVPSEGGKQLRSCWVRVSSLAKQEEESKNDDCFDWVKENNIDKIAHLQPEELCGKDENGMTLLHWAADRGFPKMTECLIDKGIDVNIQDSDGQTALHYAVSCGHTDVIKVLLAKGADLTIADSDGLLATDCADEETKTILI